MLSLQEFYGKTADFKILLVLHRNFERSCIRCFNNVLQSRMELKKELPFKGSVLETNLNNKLTDEVARLVLHTAKDKPESQFWKEAAELVEKKTAKKSKQQKDTTR